MPDFLGETKAAQAIEAAVIKVTREKIKSLAAGKMGYSTSQVASGRSGGGGVISLGCVAYLPESFVRNISLARSWSVRHFIHVTKMLNVGGVMLWRKRDKEKDRFYLLPGMGGRSLRRKRKIFLMYALLAGVFVSVLVAVTLYLINLR